MTHEEPKFLSGNQIHSWGAKKFSNIFFTNSQNLFSKIFKFFLTYKKRENLNFLKCEFNFMLFYKLRRRKSPEKILQCHREKTI